jgi:hypothetical protein
MFIWGLLFQWSSTISEKSRFYAKKSYFFQLRREVRKILGYFVWKITNLRQKIIFFQILGRARPPLDPPLGLTRQGLEMMIYRNRGEYTKHYTTDVISYSIWNSYFCSPPSAIGKNMIFWRKIVIFHTKYPNNFRASLRSVQFFQVRPPLTWNPGSAPVTIYY